jgi:two-component system OmpR family sensor kinase
VKFTAPATEVEIDARVTCDGSLVTTVSDRGPGVPAAMLEAIFEPFTRVEQAVPGATGVGLGLAIAQRALMRHGGRIDAALRDGGGLTVTLLLPKSHV